MNTLTIVFLGLVAIVPEPGREKFTVLLVDATSPGTDLGFCKPLAWRDVTEAHKAAILVEKTNLASSSCTQASVPSDPNLVAFPLWKHEIEIDTGKAPSNVHEVTGVRGTTGGKLNPIPLMNSELPDFSWVTDHADDPAAMYRLWKVNPACVDAQDPWSSATPCKLAGRLPLSDGTLSVECISPYSCGSSSYRTFKWTDGGMTTYGAPASLAEGMKLEIQEVKDSPSIILKTFGGNDSCEIKLKSAAAHRVWIVNQIAWSVAQCATGGSSHLDAFQAFYKLSSADPNVSVPCPFPTEGCTGFGSPRCPLVELDR